MSQLFLDPHNAEKALAELPAPTEDAAEHSARLGTLIAERINAAGGVIAFDEYMELALYAPGLGYYTAGARKFGDDGDFVTSPEISPLFSRCLAQQCMAVTGPDILEFGAGSGVMAADILLELEAQNALPERYLIMEVSADLRQRQAQTINNKAAHLFPLVQWLERLPDEPINGCIIANELIDALPVKRFVKTLEGVDELGVALVDNRFQWQAMPAGEGLVNAVAKLESELGVAFEPGYESEVNLNMIPWINSVAGVLGSGLVLLIDYGYERPAYYHPQRSMGTLMCHYRHRAHDDPFVWPGITDITSQVDFTRLAEAGLDAGLDFSGYTTQAYFLLGTGLQEMSQETDPGSDDPAQQRLHYARMQQIKTLTLPGEMGERFKVLGLEKSGDTVFSMPLLGFMLNDLRDRL